MDCPHETKKDQNQNQAKKNDPQRQALVAFMCQINLTQYTKNLLALGFDDLDYLSGLEKATLQNFAAQAKMLPGHACKFVDAITTRIHVPAVISKAKGSTHAMNVSGTEDAYVVCIVDCSASMISIGKEVKDGFNTFIEKQRALPGKCLATVVKFNHKVKVWKHGTDIQRLPFADARTFKPGGMTALYDAICMTVKLVKHKISSLPHKPARVIVMVLTDGQENSSAKFTNKHVMKLIRHCEKRNWTFTFIGANQDAIATGTGIGFKADNCLTYTADGDHTTETWNSMSANCCRQRLGESSAWMDEERISSISEELPAHYGTMFIGEAYASYT